MADEQYTVSVILNAVDQNLSSTLSKAENQLKSFQEGINRIPNTIDKMGQSVSNFGNSISKIGLGLTAGMLPVVKGVKDATQSFREFDEGLIKVGKTSDVSGIDLRNLGDDFLKLSKDVATPVPDLLELGEIAGQLFDTTSLSAQETSDKILNFTEVMSKMAKTTDVAGQTGAKSMMNFLNTVGLGIDNVDNLGSALVYLGNNANTTEGKIIAMAERMGLTGDLAGFTAPQILGLAATFSEFGIEAQRGASGFRMFTAEIDKGVAEGGAKLQKYAELSKMSASEFAEAWRNDPMSALKELVKGFQEAVENGEMSSVLLKELGFGGQFAQETFRALGKAIKESGSTESEFVSQLIANLERAEEGWMTIGYEVDRYGNKIKDANGEFIKLKDAPSFLDQEFAQALESVNSKWQKFISTIQQITNTIGVMLKPAITGILDDATNVINGIMNNLQPLYDKWKTMSVENQEALGRQILLLGSLALALGPVLLIGGKIIDGLGKGISTVGKLAGAVQSFGDLVVSSGQNVISGITNMASAVGELEPVSNLIYESHFKLLELSEMITNKFPIAGQIFSAFGKTVQAGSLISRVALQTVAPAAMIGAILATIGLLPDGAREHLIKMANIAEEKGPQFIAKLTMGISERIPDLISKGTEVVTAFADAIAKMLPSLIVGGAFMIASLVQGVAQNASQLITSAVKVIGQFLLGITQALPILLSAGLEMLVALIKGIADNLPLIIATAGDIIVNLIRGISENIPNILLAGVEIIIHLIRGIVTALPQIVMSGWEIIKTLVGGIFEAIGGLFGKIGSKIASALGIETAHASSEAETQGKGIADSLTQGVSTGVEETGKAFSLLPDKISESISGVSSFLDLESGTWGSLLSTNAQSAVDSTSNTLSGIKPRTQTILEETTGIVDTSTKNLADTVTNNTAGMADGMASNFQLGLDSILQSSQNVSTTVPSDASYMNEETVAQYQTMSKNIQNAMVEAEMFVRVGSEKITNHFTTMSSEIPTMFADLGTQLDASLSGVFEKVLSTMKSSLFEMQATAKRMSGTIVDTYTQTLNQLPQNTRVVLDHVAKTFDSSMSNVKSKMDNHLTEMVNKTSSSLNKIQQEFNSKFQGIDSNVNSKMSNVEKTVTSKMNNIDNIVKTKNNNMQRTFEQSFNKIEQQTQRSFTNINNTTRSGFNQMSNSFNQSTNQMQNGFQRFSSNIQNTARNTVNQIINIMRSSYNGMYNAGYYSGQGFQSGLASSAGGIYATARRIANNVTATMRRALNIHSPSRETEEIGEYTGEGYVVGMKSTMSDAINSAQDIAFKSLSAMADVMPPFIKLFKTFTESISTLIKRAETDVVNSTNNIVNSMNRISDKDVNINVNTSTSNKTTRVEKNRQKTEKQVQKDKESREREIERKRQEAEKKEQQRLENIKRQAERVKKEAVSAINNVKTQLESIHKLQEETLSLDRKHTESILGSATAYNTSLRKLKRMTTKADFIPEIPIEEVQAEIEKLDFTGLENRFVKMNDYLLEVWDKNQAILEADDLTAIELAENKTTKSNRELIESLKGVDEQSKTTINGITEVYDKVANTCTGLTEKTTNLAKGLEIGHESIEKTGELIKVTTTTTVEDVNKVIEAVLKGLLTLNKFVPSTLTLYGDFFKNVLEQSKNNWSSFMETIKLSLPETEQQINNTINRIYDLFSEKINEARNQWDDMKRSMRDDIQTTREPMTNRTVNNKQAPPQPDIVKYDDRPIDANIRLVMGSNEYSAYVKDIRNESERQERLERRF